MRDLNDLHYFVHVVDHRGITPASHALGIPKSSLSRRMLALEERLGVRLIQRTTRSFVVTEVGLEFYRHALAMVVEAEAAESAVKRLLGEPTGIVRMTCSVAMAQFALKDLLPRFMAAYPKVQIVQHAANRHVDLISEGFDIGLRAHFKPLVDSNLIQRVLVPTPWHLFAAAAYLERAGTPEQPEDLQRHDGLLLGGGTTDSAWTLTDPQGATVSVPFAARMRSDDMVTLKRAAELGLGIVAVPAYVCVAEVGAGTLRRVLPGWIAGRAEITMLSPTRRGLLPAVRALADFLASEMPQVVAGPASVLA